MTTTKAFDASKYLTNLNGRDYLEVKWRLLWLRTEHPDAVIETELVKHGGGLALFRARAAIPGAGVATGWGSETADDFGDYIEKAETKALGRALAALGYGTQFCEDFDFSADAAKRGRRASASASGTPRQAASPRPEYPASHTRVVDSPVSPPEGLKVIRDGVPGATPSQIKAIYCIGRDQPAMGEEGVEQRCRAVFGRLPAELSKRQASEFIDLLRRPAATAKAIAVGTTASAE
jgi:hypothetical protein